MFYSSILVIAAWLVVFLMVTKAVEPNYLLSFLAYAVFLIGFTVGMVSAFTHVQREKKAFKENYFPDDVRNPRKIEDN